MIVKGVSGKSFFFNFFNFWFKAPGAPGPMVQGLWCPWDPYLILPGHIFIFIQLLNQFLYCIAYWPAS